MKKKEVCEQRKKEEMKQINIQAKTQTNFK